jgi:hypothetical protein
MKGPEFLLQHTDKLKTRMGGCFLGNRVVFRGKDLHSDLNDVDWLDLYMSGITGRRFTNEQLRMLNGLWICTSYPDARIWNNRVAALAGSMRSTGNLGISAALAVSEASIYGRGVDIRAIDFIIRTKKELDNGSALADCIKKELKINRGISGYGRPLTSGDERLEPIMNYARKYGFDQGAHIRLAYSIDAFLLEGRWRMRMNAAALGAAIGADIGLSAREYYLFLFPAFLAGMQPCFIEAAERPEGSLFPLACSHILYEGQSKRGWRKD